MILDLDVMPFSAVVEARLNLEHERHLPAHDDDATNEAVAMAGGVDASTGMKSSISATPFGVKNRVMSTFVSGK